MILASFAFLFLSVWYICNFLTGFGKERIIYNNSNLSTGIMYLLFSFILVLLTEIFNDDMYTTKKHDIEKIIDKKVKRYDKVQDKYFL